MPRAQSQAEFGELLADRVTLRDGLRAGALVQLVGLLEGAGQQRDPAERGQLVRHLGAQAELLGDPQPVAVQLGRTAVYHATVPSGLPAQAADSLSGALTEASALSGAAAESLVATARAAFTSGLNVAGVVAAVLVAGAAVLAVTLLRHVPPAGVPADEPEGATTVNA